MTINNIKTINAITISLGILNLILICNYLIFPVLDVDTGYYLSMAREVYSGKIYFHEIAIPYNPLSILAMGIPFLFSTDPDYFWHLLINIIIMVYSSLIMYKILSYISKNACTNRFFSMFFLFLCLVLQGKYTLLEPLSVCFQLLAVLLFLKFKSNSKNSTLILVGLFIALAFLSKQYGLFIAIPIGLQLLFDKKRILKKILFLGIGVIIPLVVFYVYLFKYNVSLSLFLKYILGQGTEMDQGNGTSLTTSFFTYPMDFIYIMLFNLYVLIIPYLIFKYFKLLDSNKYLYFILFLTSLSVLYFANYWHYYQYIVPYAIILFVFLIQKTKIKVWSMVLPLVSICFLTFYALNNLNKLDDVEKTKKQTEKVLTKIPEGSEVFLSGPSQVLYYTCKFKSINLKTIGFTFPSYFYPKTITENLNAGAYLVISAKEAEVYKKMINNYQSDNIVLNGDEYLIIKKL